MDDQAQGTQAQVPGTPSSIYTTKQQKTLFDIAVKQADDEYAQAQLEGTARLNFMNNKPVPTAMREDDDSAGKMPPKVKAFSSQFAGLPQVEIVRIFSNKFRR